MAGNLPVPNGVEMKLTWALAGTPQAINILHFSNPSAATMTQAIADARAASVRTAFTSSALNAQIHTSVTLAKIELRSMTANSDAWFTGAGATVAGTATGKILPAATALVVSLKTGLRGRSYNGRIYLWGFAEVANDTAGGVATAAAVAASTFASTIRTSFAGASPAFVSSVLSRFTTPPGATAPIERTPPILTPVATEPADQRWDVQRRRAVPGI